MFNVICYARSITHTKPVAVVLQSKHGIWLPSGTMFEGGIDVENAFQTLFETTGILADKQLIQQAGVVYVNHDFYSVMDCPFRGEYVVDTDLECNPTVMTQNRLLKDKRTSPLTSMVASLCHGGKHGWSIHRLDPKTLHLRMP